MRDLFGVIAKLLWHYVLLAVVAVLLLWAARLVGWEVRAELAVVFGLLLGYVVGLLGGLSM